MKFTFARVVILLCVVLSGALGVFAWSQQKAIEEMRTALAPGGEVEDLVREIQVYSREHTELMKQKEGDLLSDEDQTPESYIRGVAYRPDVSMGQIEVDPDTRDDKSFVDMIYRINADDKAKKFTRTHLANFFFKLEEKSNRVKVTLLEVKAAEKRLDPHEIPSDNWTFKAEVTLRRKK
ncbi:MAG: hypothetical protein ACI8QZ_000126 [Chlamydiales bacterium]|jgi:hypothetical protein